MTNVSRYGCHAITVDGEGPECVTPLPCLSSRPKFAASQVTLSPLRGSEHAVSVTSKTNTDLVVDALRASSRPLDDDQLAIRSGVRPRQTVNRICRDLERSGVLRRFLGPDLKTVNELLVTAANDDPLGGSSHEQRAAESTMLAELAQVIGLNSPHAGSCTRPELASRSTEPMLTFGFWSSAGRTKPGQGGPKVQADE